jgi:two-component system chemotaxis response regulator CheY
VKQILVIDDSPVARRFLSGVLKNAGYRVEEASGGLEAMEKALAASFDLILCDINMIGMDGLSFIRKYREDRSDTPIIIVTTQTGDEDRRQGFLAGADLYVEKPVSPEGLIAHVRIVLGVA